MKFKNIIIIVAIILLMFSNTMAVFAAGYKEAGDWDAIIGKALSGKTLTQEEANHLKNDKVTSTFYDSSTIESVKEMLQNGSIKVEAPSGDSSSGSGSSSSGSGSSSSGSGSSSSGSGSSSSTTPGAEYWHPKNMQSKLDQWKDMKALSASDVEAIENYFSGASTSNIQALTQTDIGTIIQILNNVAKTKNTSARPTPQVAKRLQDFTSKLYTTKVNGKNIATSSQITTLKNLENKFKELQAVSEKEEQIANVINNPETGAADTNEIKNIQENYNSIIRNIISVEDNGDQGDKINHGIGHTAGEIIEEADNFINSGGNGNSIISEGDLKELSDTIYNILLVVAIVIAVLLGSVLGIKFLMEGATGKAEVKKALIPYAIGCAVVFGSFIIWKIVVTILQGLQ